MAERNLVSDRLIDFHRAMAAGGLGMTTVAYLAVSEDGQGAPAEIVVRPGAQPGLRKLADAVRDAADHAARLLGLPRSWLNNQASGYVSRTPGRGVLVVDHPHLRVVATNPEHLLAMKVRAARAVRDSDDIRVLIVHLNIVSLTEIRAVVRRYFPEEPLSARSLELVTDILREVRGVVDGR